MFVLESGCKGITFIWNSKTFNEKIYVFSKFLANNWFKSTPQVCAKTCIHYYIIYHAGMKYWQESIKTFWRFATMKGLHRPKKGVTWARKKYYIGWKMRLQGRKTKYEVNVSSTRLCHYYIVSDNYSHGISRARCFLTLSFESGRTNPCQHISCHRWHGFLYHTLWIWHII